jgi:hypothetical protein
VIDRNRPEVYLLIRFQSLIIFKAERLSTRLITSTLTYLLKVGYSPFCACLSPPRSNHHALVTSNHLHAHVPFKGWLQSLLRMSVIVFAWGLHRKLASRFILGPVSFLAITRALFFFRKRRSEEVSKIYYWAFLSDNPSNNDLLRQHEWRVGKNTTLAGMLLHLPTSRSRIASGERRSLEPRDRLVSLAGIWIRLKTLARKVLQLIITISAQFVNRLSLDFSIVDLRSIPRVIYL